MEVVNLLKNEVSSKKNFSEYFIDSIDQGFSKSPKKLSSEFFYDDEGSKLFQEITKQPEYYLTKTELSILKEYSDSIVDEIGEKEIDVIELGAGDGHKTKILLNSFKTKNVKVNYYPIDISSEAINLLKDFITEDENFHITAIVSKYFEGIEYTQEHSKNKKLVLFLGSNIGNTDESKGLETLKQISQKMNSGDYLLTGFDLDKDISVLSAAYNDKNGVTRDFNFNLLKRMNNELDGNINAKHFTHMSRYNPEIRAMESFLISNIDQDIHFKSFNKQYSFKEFEPLHLEYSFKYDLDEIAEMADKSNFKTVKNFIDNKGYFSNSLWTKL